MKCVKCLEEVKGDKVYCDKCDNKSKNNLKNLIIRKIIFAKILFSVGFTSIIMMVWKFFGVDIFSIILYFAILIFELVMTCRNISKFRRQDIKVVVGNPDINSTKK